MKTSRLEKLKSQREKLNARIQAVEARTKTAERKKDTRRKILVGSYYLEQAIEKKGLEEIRQIMDGYLKRDSDRTIFGLEPLTKTN